DRIEVSDCNQKVNLFRNSWLKRCAEYDLEEMCVQERYSRKNYPIRCKMRTLLQYTYSLRETNIAGRHVANIENVAEHAVQLFYITCYKIFFFNFYEKNKKVLPSRCGIKGMAKFIKSLTYCRVEQLV
ncbi:hypothetical protein L9F63_014877, partial [Diploptera punctata]